MRQLFLMIFVVFVALTSCQKRAGDTPETPNAGIALQLVVPQSSIVQTKVQSSAEMTLTNLWLFTFNASGVLENKCLATGLDNATHTAKVSVPKGAGLGLYACANVSAAQEALFNAFQDGVTTLAELKAITTSRAALKAPGLPMWGALTGQTISPTTTTITMSLARICSRVDVVASGISDFTFVGIEKLLKTASSAPLGAAASPAPATAVENVVPTDKTLSSIYLYENGITATTEADAESRATAVIIQGTYKGYSGYYKLRVKYGSAPVKYDIGRNVIYSINITGVRAPGFATLAEAEANFPQNVDYSVTAADGDATDLVTSNGQYYLGVSNSAFATYTDAGVTGATITTVTHNAPSSITAGTVTASGAGLTLTTTSIPTSAPSTDIKADLAPTFTSGTLTLRLGNLIKTITVTKRATVGLNGAVNADFATTNFVSGDLDEATPTWFKLGKNNTTPEPANRVYNSAGGLWLHLSHNVGATNVARTSGAYITSLGDKGRARVWVNQAGAILKYVSGAPTTKIDGVSPAPFAVTVSTQLAGWTLKAYSGLKDDKTTPVALTFGAKTGSPALTLPAVGCSVPVTLPVNPGNERTVQLYLSCTEVPSVELWFGSVVQLEDPVPYVVIGSLKWTTGNLVAKGSNDCQVGSSTDYGLYFQWGSLVGWSGGSGDGTGAGQPAMAQKVKPVGYSGSASWPAAYYSGGTENNKGYNLPGDSPSSGIGDPCRYYLGGKWRTPTAAEWLTLMGASGANTDQGVPLKVIGYALYFPGSGDRSAENGSFRRVGSHGFYRSSSVIDNLDGYCPYFTTNSVYPQDNRYRADGLPVRCVSNK